MAELKPHGTSAAYRRHLRAREEPCAACRAANSAEVQAKRAADRRPAVPPVLVPHPSAAQPAEDGPVPLDRAGELRWQAEQLREGIAWAVVNDPGKVAGMSRERRETLAELEQAEHESGAGAAGGGDAVGAFLDGPLSLVPSSPAPVPGA